jgi:1-acyl-sn-glycerol-3-phosphate acyltransferase
MDMPNFIISFFQLLSYFVFYIPLRIFYLIEGEPPSNIKELKRGSLLVSNHQSYLDPWIVMHKIPFWVGLRLLPIYFPIAHKYMGNPYFSRILKLVGGYDIGATSRENMLGLIYTRRLLSEGKTVFLFPEGKIARNGSEILEFKKGIEFFTKDAKNIIFVRMKGFNEVKLPCFLADCKMALSDVQNIEGKDISVKKLKLIFNSLDNFVARNGVWQFEWQRRFYLH